MGKQNLFEIGFSSGIVLGFAIDKEKLQLALLFGLVQVNFNLIGQGLKRFRECFKEN